jgi:purine catabolism regulator
MSIDSKVNCWSSRFPWENSWMATRARSTPPADARRKVAGRAAKLARSGRGPAGSAPIRPAITLADLVDNPTLGLRVIAGGAGLHRSVSWAHVSELEDPTPWLQGSELIMTTGLGVPHEGAAQRKYIARMDDYGVAGLAVSERLFMPRLQQEFLDEAERRAFPVVEVAITVPFIAISQEVAAANQALLQRRLQSHVRIFATLRSVAGQDLTPAVLFAELERLSGYRLYLTSPAGRPLLGGVPAPPPELLPLVPASPEVPPGIQGGYVVPVPLGGRATGFLLAMERTGAEPAGLAAVQHIATIAALQLVSLDHEREILRREGAETLAELLSDALRGDAAIRRLALAGFDTNAPAMLLAVQGTTGPGEACTTDQEHAVARTLIEQGVPHLLLRQNELYVLIPTSEGVPEAVAGVPGVSVGASAPFPLGGRLGAARREALWSLFRAVERKIAVARFQQDEDQDAWLPQDTGALLDLVDRVLGPALRRDEQRGTELLGSVRAWMQAGRRTDAAARALGIHPNTLAYRIKRFERLTGRDLTITADIVNVWLALRAEEVLRKP